jgi:hypothetical protein
MTPTFGRLPSPPDARDRAFLLSARTPAKLPLRKTWQFRHAPLDQREYPHCVAFASLAMLLAFPITASPLRAGETPAQYAASLYREAQTLDSLPGTDYDGTTVRGAAKALKARGLLTSYAWAWDAATVVRYVLTRGPVVLGVDWFEGMTELGHGATAYAKGASLGGHAVLMIGADPARGRVRLLNSWGAEWGENGRCWLAIKDLDKLLRNGGEACSAIEAPR